MQHCLNEIYEEASTLNIQKRKIQSEVAEAGESLETGQWEFDVTSQWR